MADLLPPPLLAPGIRLAPTQAAALERALEYVDAHLSRPLRIAELAEAACVSRYHLARLFRAAVGESPSRYLRRRRIEAARRMLLQGPQPMSRLALHLGFFDQSHFVRSFRAETGCSPGQYVGQAQRDAHAALHAS